MSFIVKYKKFIIIAGLLVGIGKLFEFLPVEIMSISAGTSKLIYAAIIGLAGFVFFKYYPEKPIILPETAIIPKPKMVVRYPQQPVQVRPKNIDEEMNSIEIPVVDRPVKPSRDISDKEDIYKGF